MKKETIYDKVKIDKLFSMNKSFCILPFVQISIKSRGRISPCCRSRTIGNFYKKPLLSIWNSKAYKDIREKMIKGKKPKECENCWQAEESGNLSYRQLYNERKGIKEKFRKQLHLINDDFSMPEEIKILDIGYTGLCNLKCRMCDDYIEYKKQKPTNKKIGKSFLKQKLKNVSPYLEIVKITGGEPFVNPHHEVILKELLPNAHSISLLYSTNLSFSFSDYKEIFNLWKKFKDVTVVFSLDGIGEVNDYIRVGSKQERILKNALKLYKIKNIKKITCSFTLQALNAFDLPNVVRCLIKEPRIIFYCNVLYTPKFLNIHILPKNLKQDLRVIYESLKKEIKECSLEKEEKQHYIDIINMLIAYLKKPIDNSNLIPEFIKHNQKIDKKYQFKKSFSDVVPELDILKIVN